MIRGFLNLPWFAWMAIAIVYSFVWPRRAVTATADFRFFILRWGHALAWVLIAVNFLLRGIDPSLNGSASFFALAGGSMYLLFMAVTFVVK